MTLEQPRVILSVSSVIYSLQLFTVEWQMEINFL